MSAKTVNDMTRSAVLAAWGIATLVLLFSVILLGYQLYNRGARAPEAISLPAGVVDSTQPGQAPTGQEAPIQLYFGSLYSSGLRSETRMVNLPGNTIGNCKAAFTALAAGPRSEGVAVLAPSARIRAMYLMAPGDLVVDFSRDVDVPDVQSASAELLLVRALTMTLTHSGLHGGDGPAIRRVRFLFEGAPTGGHFPEHIKLDFPIEPESSWVIPARTKDGDV